MRFASSSGWCYNKTKTNFLRVEFKPDQKGFILSIVLGLFMGFSISAATTSSIDVCTAEFACQFLNNKVHKYVLLDTIPFNERYGNHLTGSAGNAIDLNDPNVIEKTVEYDPVSNRYIITEKVGDNDFRPPIYLTFDEYMTWQHAQQQKAYFDNLAGIKNDFITFNPNEDPVEQFNLTDDLINRLFGGTDISIKPTGNIDIPIGVQKQIVLNPNVPLRTQRPPLNFFFNMDINMGLKAQIGEKLNLNFNYNTSSTFSFDNRMNLKFDSEAFSEDDIIKNIEAGNVSLPLKSSLIQGNQSLFGLKTELQFGRLYLTAVVSQQQSERKTVQLQEGAQWQEFSIKADEYDQNRHFFLSQYNRNTYEANLADLPQIRTQFKIKRIEVWVTSINNEYEDLRQIVGLTDLGEAAIFSTDNARDQFEDPNISPIYEDNIKNEYLPDNKVNLLYEELLSRGEEARDLSTVVPLLQLEYGMSAGRDFEQRRARKLSPNRYTLHPELGLISLNQELRPDEVLGVAYEYTMNGENFQVGEFSGDVTTYTGENTDSLNQATDQVLLLKMLKSSTQDVSLPMWDLMMKNVYAIGAYQASPEEFNFDIYYEDPSRGVKRFLPEPGFETPLMVISNLDNLNYYGDPQPDGFFDFIPGLTINTQSGKVMFPVLEPFGSSLENYLPTDDLIEKYSYQILYDTTVWVAREYQEKNRFVMKGTYKTNVSSEISLGALNLPQGSVKVTSGGTLLTEGLDYEVDYQIGLVRITNDAYLSSGAPVQVSYEDRALIGLQRQSMLGLRADYTISKKAILGGTAMKLWERPYTPKVNAGDDPINNAIYGLDFSFSDESAMLTKVVDAIPGIKTSAKSNVDFYVEGAVLKPGHTKSIDVGNDEGGVVYIDDFEGSATGITLSNQVNRWYLASVPQGHQDFPEAQLTDDFAIGANRALLNWYNIDTRIGGSTNNSQDPYERTYFRQEIFPGSPQSQNLFNFRTFDLTYYPNERGPYNMDPVAGTAYSAGLELDQSNGDLLLKEPASRWAGIMREINQPNFERANVEAIEFWVLNPFIGQNQEGGEMYINLGNVSEDILKDGHTLYENGLPTADDNVVTPSSNLGRYAQQQPVIFVFSVDEMDRDSQDLGLDGYALQQERAAFQNYVRDIQTLSAQAAATVNNDPSNDDYVWFNDESFDNANVSIRERYKRYNNPEGNSPITNNSATYSNSYTAIPDAEDINQDGSSDKTETYFEYKIKLENQNGELADNPFITDVQDNGDGQKWYRFKIPINNYSNKIGAISDFRSIRYIRMYLKDFEESVTLRFARIQLLRNQWRKVTRTLDRGPTLPGGDPSLEVFDINAVNIQENSSRIPFSYTLPPGINQEQNYQSSFTGDYLNEQALELALCGIPNKQTRAVYKTIDMNMREYERLKMFVHLDKGNNNLSELKDGDLRFILRLGSDYIDNYYEYEMPMVFSENIDDSDYEKKIWPDTNLIDLVLSDFKDLKIKRNQLAPGSTTPFGDTLYFNNDPSSGVRGILRVNGNPNLGMVTTILMGVRNESQEEEWCADIWTNELRLVGLNEQGGAAAIGRLDFKLADFGTVNLSGNISTIGWGSIDQKLLERSRSQESGYDVTSNLQLDKFLPKKWGVHIPFFAQLSNTTSTPKFDPYDLDIPLKEKLDLVNGDTRDSIRKQAVTQTTVKTIAFTNVRKDPTALKKGKPIFPWSISNFSLSYARTKTESSNPILKIDNSHRQTGILDYSYSPNLKEIYPFKKLIKTDKWVRFIKDFNFNPLPSSFTFRSSMDKKRRDRQFRFTDDEFERAISRQFLWNRDYNLSWNLAKSLRFNYSARNVGAVDELGVDGATIGENEYPYGTYPGNKERNEYLWQNVKRFGRNKDFTQDFDITYKLPFKEFGLLDWISTDVQYSAGYQWTSASLNVLFSEEELYNTGNTIRNNRDESVRVNLNFEKLYNKSKYLAAINRGPSSRGKKKNNSDGAKKTAPTDANKKDAKEKNKKKAKNPDPSTAARIILRPLMLLRKGQLSVTNSYSTFVPGYNQETHLLGLSKGFNEPGWDFILGKQVDVQWLRDKATQQDGILVGTYLQNQETVWTRTKNWDASLSVEPFKDFDIQIDAHRNYTNTQSGLFKFFEKANADGDNWYLKGDNQYGSFDITYVATKTLMKDGKDNIEGLFDVFQKNLSVVSKRLGGSTTNEIYGSDFTDGYGISQQDVVIPAFLAAYAGKDAGNIDLDLFKQKAKPNWGLTYKGLTKIPWFKERFSRISISHKYTSTLSVNRYISDLRYGVNVDGEQNRNEVTQDYYSQFTYPALIIREGMSPLFKIDVATLSNFTFNMEYGKDRTLSLDPDNQQLNETRASAWKAGLGIVWNDVYLGFLPGMKKQKKNKGKKKDKADPKSKKKSSSGKDDVHVLKFNFDFSLRDDVTYQHTWGIERASQPTRGQRRITISPAFDYTLNKNINLRLFFDYSKLNPKTGASFPITNYRGGIRIRYSLN